MGIAVIKVVVQKRMLAIVLCGGWMLGGCATLPSLKPVSVDTPLNSVATPLNDAASTAVTQTIEPTAQVAVASQNADSSNKPEPDVTDIISTPPCPAPIQQVGFRHRLHVGDDCGCQFGPCADNACGSSTSSAGCVVPGVAMPVVPQPWYYDPQEFLCDGGDQAPNATLRRDDRIIGLQTEDTVSHYTTDSGDIEFTESNRVCIYSPRFGAVRRITGALSNDHAIGASGVNRPVGPQGVDYDLPGLVMTDTVEVDHEQLTRRIDSMRDRNRGVRIENIQQLEMAADVLEVLAGIRNLALSQIDESQLAAIERFAIAANAWTIDESVEVEILDMKPPVLTRDQKIDSLVVYEFPDAGRLNLIKVANKQHAAIGEEVTFALRLQNVGDSAVSNVVVTDNLTTRLVYVPDSQTASIKADFESRANDADSAQLIWTLKEELDVGESVLIEFKCRVR